MKERGLPKSALLFALRVRIVSREATASPSSLGKGVLLNVQGRLRNDPAGGASLLRLLLLFS
jgi:hypothetical protein